MEESPVESKKNIIIKKYKWVGIIGIVLIIISIIGITKYQQYSNNKNYNLNISEAQKNIKAEKFSEAIKDYKTALTYKADSSVNSKIELCNELQSSLKDFRNGTELQNNKDYLGAYNAFKSVSSKDVKRFVVAKGKISECFNSYSRDVFLQAKDLAIKLDYQGAIDDVNLVLSIDSNNENAKVLNTQYQASLQKKTDDDKRAEEIKKKEEADLAAKKKIDEARGMLRVTSLYPSAPNSADGVDLNIAWENCSSKVIKYITFEVVPYNAVGDVQTCNIRGKSNFRGKVTGPIYIGGTDGGGSLWECAWYNNTITSVKLVGVNITYMDDSTASLDSTQVQYVIN
ncbi:hypothetical protein [Clostridium estertheticum]|uniref:DUF5780 domain-containing protein n=1 Tax=Clostridium estertheticum TaxID=238834 RepID=A0A7Y3WSX7_9CLOT|nr:hypothetical protein [Clostridium estertheticum]NNU77577.1 hypothetical protein [Clostridium estertheticum]WBL48480.1 hypothetical protein LOR37_07435 [Clostridium estertheticum]